MSEAGIDCEGGVTCEGGEFCEGAMPCDATVGGGELCEDGGCAAGVLCAGVDLRTGPLCAGGVPLKGLLCAGGVPLKEPCVGTAEEGKLGVGMLVGGVGFAMCGDENGREGSGGSGLARTGAGGSGPASIRGWMCVTCDSKGDATFFGSGSSILCIKLLFASRSAGVE
jgi:hypothetical protein